MPTSANEIKVIVADAAEKRGLRKNRTSSMGWSERSSHSANNTRNESPTPSGTVTPRWDQPESGTWMIA